MMVINRILQAVAIICTLSLLSTSCSNSTLKEANLKEAKQYTGYVAIEKLARYLTENGREQKLVINFLSNMEENFKINPHVLFQNSNYLTVVFGNTSYERITLYFTEQEPKIVDGLLVSNGYLSYSYTNYNHFAYFKSRYQGPSRYGGDWSSGLGSDGLGVKTINLNDPVQFDWYQH